MGTNPAVTGEDAATDGTKRVEDPVHLEDQLYEKAVASFARGDITIEAMRTMFRREADRRIDRSIEIASLLHDPNEDEDGYLCAVVTAITGALESLHQEYSVIVSEDGRRKHREVLVERYPEAFGG